MTPTTTSSPRPFRGVGSGVDAVPPSPTDTASRAGRRDGRAHNEMREIGVVLGPSALADGSARVQVGHTDVLAVIHGPMEASTSRQSFDKLTIHLTLTCCSAEEDATTARFLKQLVNDVLLSTLFPRKALLLSVHVLSDSGSAPAVAANACMLALLDAGIPMPSLPLAASVAVHGRSLTVDPSQVEEREAHAVITAVFFRKDSHGTHDNNNDSFVAVHTNGRCTNSQAFDAALHTARLLSAQTRIFVLKALQLRASRALVHNRP